MNLSFRVVSSITIDTITATRGRQANRSGRSGRDRTGWTAAAGGGHGLGSAGTGGTVGGDAPEEFAGGFVGGVLRNELAGEGVAQDGLAQGLGCRELGVDLGFEVVDDGELVFDELDDGFLLCLWSEGKRKSCEF